MTLDALNVQPSSRFSSFSGLGSYTAGSNWSMRNENCHILRSNGHYHTNTSKDTSLKTFRKSVQSMLHYRIISQSHVVSYCTPKKFCLICQLACKSSRNQEPKIKPKNPPQRANWHRIDNAKLEHRGKRNNTGSRLAKTKRFGMQFKIRNSNIGGQSPVDPLQARELTRSY